ncbi:MAG: LemA family protein [Patescibacteria group bacterium]
MEPITMTLAIIVLAIVLFFIFTYNRLVVLKNRVKEAWSDIDVQLKRRHELIPDLVETVKGYAEHEKEIFEEVAQARERALSATKEGDPKKIQKSENQLKGALKSLFAVAENYPDLKASDNFLELQKEIRDTEDKIQSARRFYNRNVKAFNIKIQTIPYNFVASMLNYKAEDYFEAEEEEKENVEVSF